MRLCFSSMKKTCGGNKMALFENTWKVKNHFFCKLYCVSLSVEQDLCKGARHGSFEWHAVCSLISCDLWIVTQVVFDFVVNFFWFCNICHTSLEITGRPEFWPLVIFYFYPVHCRTGRFFFVKKAERLMVFVSIQCRLVYLNTGHVNNKAQAVQILSN